MEVFNIKTLKSKIAFIYIFLVLIIAMIGVISGFNMYRLGRSIDGLMTDNYKSISVINDMLNSIEAEDKAILQCILFQNKSAVDSFYNNNDEFYKSLNIEENNITEAGEKELVEKINKAYINILESFSELQDYQINHSINETIDHYNNNVTPNINKVKQDLKTLTTLNEKAMFGSKDKVKINAHVSLYIILIISAAAVFLGLFISMVYTNKSLRPIYLLTETIKSVKEGEMNKQAPVIYEDEIGMLAKEFNSMTKRLHEFEQSTMGNLLAEKNKSIAIVKSISDPLIVLDSNYKITLLNKSFENLFGVKEEKVINNHFLDVIRNKEFNEYISNFDINNISSNDKIINLELKNKTYYFSPTITVVRNREEKIKDVIVFLKNVTEFKELENIRTDFIATISHEFKTPLTSIMMGAGLMLDRNIGLLNEKQKKILDTIKEEVQKLTDLVNNLLKLSRIQSDRAIFDIKPCAIEDIIRSSINNYHEEAEINKVKLYSIIEEGLALVYADSEKITWVLNNLISNALRYTSQGDQIIIGAHVEDDNMKVYVQDTGKGIPIEYQERIFEKFVKINSYSAKFITTGLGLFISKEIVEAHGGIISCESKIDEGSIFTFSLPLEKI
jgi:PAS domain S-box-containing protein